MIAKVRFKKKHRRMSSRIPGKTYSIKKYSAVLIRGGGARDLPGVNFTCCRGVYDFLGLYTKKRRRSIYGVKKPAETKRQPLRRKYRKYLV